ncbi:hypothetical protein ACWCQP_45835 [Streptomyces chartreusis]
MQDPTTMPTDLVRRELARLHRLDAAVDRLLLTAAAGLGLTSATGAGIAVTAAADDNIGLLTGASALAVVLAERAIAMRRRVARRRTHRIGDRTA